MENLLLDIIGKKDKTLEDNQKIKELVNNIMNNTAQTLKSINNDDNSKKDINENISTKGLNNDYKKCLFDAVGINVLNNSYGFLIKNQENINDTNWYIVFPDHCLPSTVIEIPFLIGSSLIDYQGIIYKGYNTLLYFTVIGTDNSLDLAVAVFNPRNPQNFGKVIDPETLPINILEVFQIDNPGPIINYTYKSQFFYVNNNDIQKTKSLKSTTIENYYYNGASDMVQFFYPSSILIQELCMSGTSGSPLVDEQLNCIGMLVHLVGQNPKLKDENAKKVDWAKYFDSDNTNTNGYQPLATHSRLLYPVIFKTIIPNYLAQVQYAIINPELPNIFNDVDYTAEYLAKGIPKAYLGFYGMYYNNSLLNICFELNQAPTLDGFLIMGFYRAYDLSTNTFLKTNYVREQLDNTKVRIYSPFNPSNQKNSFLYEHLNRAQIRFILLDEITYTNKYTGLPETLFLSSNNSSTNGNLSFFLYFADTTKPFRAGYYYYLNREWIYTIEEIVPQQETYQINGATFQFLTTDFPTFILGNEPVLNNWNTDISGNPYHYNPLQFDGHDESSCQMCPYCS